MEQTRESEQGAIVQLATRMPRELRWRFHAACAQSGVTAQEVISSLITEWLTRQRA